MAWEALCCVWVATSPIWRQMAGLNRQIRSFSPAIYRRDRLSIDLHHDTLLGPLVERFSIGRTEQDTAVSHRTPQRPLPDNAHAVTRREAVNTIPEAGHGLVDAHE